jgi:hypothetical protein
VFDQLADEKVFILHEADRMIPFIDRIVTDIADELSNLRSMAGQIQRLKEESLNPDSGRARIQIAGLEAEAAIIKERLISLKEEIEELGLYYPSFSRCQVEFPSRLRGTRAILVWVYGDKKVKWYRWPEDAGHTLRAIPQ